MKPIFTILFLLYWGSNGYGQSNSIDSSFNTFKKALLSNDCNKLAEISHCSISGDMGLARLLNTESPRNQMKEMHYEISDSLLLESCDFLDSIELAVLKDFEINTTQSGISYEGCVYRAYLNVAMDKQTFYWSVGCVDVVHDTIGEYSILFYFRRINGVYKLVRIAGAG